MSPDHIHDILRRRAEAEKAIAENITEEEFVQAARTAGWKEEDIRLHAKLCKAFGAHVHVGSRMLGIKEGNDGVSGNT